MASEVITIRVGQRPPGSWDACLFIAGPMPDLGPSAVSWHPEFIALLRDQWKYDGSLVVFVPDQGRCDRDNADWYVRARDIADVAVLWWPDDSQLSLMPSVLAGWQESQRVVLGAPSRAPRSRDLLKLAESQALSTADTLAGLARAALDKIGDGARRTAGEREVPLPVWRTPSFQRWYSAQTTAGNTLLGARPVWTFSTGPGQRFLLYWALHVRVRVRAEDRVKSNEVVISRPDISVVALYRRGATIDDTTIVLIREFRSSASTLDGFVHELPSGSGSAGADALDQAITETEEETGLAVDPSRIRVHGSRQLAATVSAHHAHLFAAEITDDELIRLSAARSAPHGASDGERTWPEITTFAEIRRERLVDWATLGMITAALLDEGIPPGP